MMKFQATKNYSLYTFFLFLFVLLLSLVICLFILKYIAVDHVATARARYESYILAHELRQSSDDLSKMARQYVMTGEKKYRDYYNEIITIRNGISPRPVDYNQIYWDLVLDNKRPRLYGPPQSLKSEIIKNQFTLEQFALLDESENESQNLTEMEIRAMNAVEGKFQDKNGNYTIIGKPDHQLAEELVFGDLYMNQKIKIMLPLQSFFENIHQKSQLIIDKLDKMINGVIGFVLLLSILSTLLMVISVFKTIRSLSKVNTENDLLLLNILPESIAIRLKKGEEEIADEFPQASVLFADIVNFTQLTIDLGPKETVGLLNELFHGIDELSEKYQIEKVKTIGDNYMAVCGVPIQNTNHNIQMANYALAILETINMFNERHQRNIQVRIGIHCGTVIAGVIGHKKFVYDVWGNVVNIASRLEATSLPNKIHVSEKVAMMIEDAFVLEPLGPIELKGLGMFKTFFLVGKKESPHQVIHDSSTI